MKTVVPMLIVALAASPLAADPTVREQVTEILAHSDEKTPPPPTAKQMSRKLPPKGNLPPAEPVVTLPDYEVIAPRTLIQNKEKIELQLAKNQVAVRQDEAQVKPTEIDKTLNNDAFHYDLGFATFAFGGGSASARAANAKYRLQVLDLEEKVLVTGVASDDADRKDLERLVAKLKGPTLY